MLRAGTTSVKLRNRQYGYYYYHERCATKLVIPAEPLRCPDCGRSYPWLGLAKAMDGIGYYDCTECGRKWEVQMRWGDSSQSEFTYCHICKLPIYFFTGQELIHGPSHLDQIRYPEAFGLYSIYAAYHPSCVPVGLRNFLQRKEQEQKQYEADREKKNGFWNRLFRS